MNFKRCIEPVLIAALVVVVLFGIYLTIKEDLKAAIQNFQTIEVPQ